MPTNRELDNLIDAALPDYSAAEPRPGLDRRILANALAQPPRRNWRLLVWALAIPAIACVIALLWMAHPYPVVPSIPQPTVAVTQHPPTPQPTPEIARQIPPGKRPLLSRSNPTTTPEIAAAAPLPKQDVFPTPTPITPEEERMLTFTDFRLRPPAQSEDIAEIPPLHIAELNIEPLTEAETETTNIFSNNPEKSHP